MMDGGEPARARMSTTPARRAYKHEAGATWRPLRGESDPDCGLPVERLDGAPRRLVRRRRLRAGRAEDRAGAQTTLPCDEVAARALRARDLDERGRRHDLDPVEHDADRDFT